MSTVYSIAGHNIQDFGANPRESRVSFQQSQDMGKSNRSRQSLMKKHNKLGDNPVNDADLVQSYNYDNDFTALDSKIDEQNEDEKDRDIMYEPQDLGADYFSYLQGRYREQNQISTSDHRVLFDYWKMLKKREQAKKNDKSKKDQMTARIRDDLTDSQAKKYAEILDKKEKDQKKLEAILNSNQQDVEYTLKIHASESKKEMTMSQFFQKRAKEIKEDRRSSKKPDQKSRQESQNRLYQNKKKAPEYPEDKKKREKEEKKLEKQKKKDLEYQKQIKKQQAAQDRTEFVNNVIKAHQQIEKDKYEEDYNYEVVNNYRTPSKLESFYQGLDKNEKDKHQLGKYDDISNEEVRTYIDLYFQDRAEALIKLHQMKQGYHTNNVNYIVKCWKNKTTEFERQKYSVDFEDEGNVKECLEKYFEQQQEEQRKEQQMQEKIEQEKQEEQEEKERKIQENMEKQVSKLAKPKDRLKLGKDILLLKKMFPKDKFLRKLIIEEFQNTRLAKFPEEYDVYDSDEENHRKERQKHQKAGLEGLEDAKNKKEAFIRELFEKRLEEYKYQKEKEIEDKKEKEIKEFKDEMRLNKFLNGKAKEFIAERQKRFENIGNEGEEQDLEAKKESTFTLKNFLSKTFKELKQGDLKNITLRKFPDKKYGESKKLKERSFPTSFKRHFFVIVKQYLREQGGVGPKDGHQKLPFWAPGGDGNRCRVHDKTDCPKNCKYITNNKKIWELMRNIVKDKKRELAIKNYQKQLNQMEDKRGQEYDDERERIQGEMIKLQREQNSAWVDEKFVEEKKKILATNADVEHCTFMPDVRNLREGRTFEKWVDDWGENFKKKKPRIYKLGVLKQCGIYLNQKRYLETYSKLRETFNIEDIKQHFLQEQGKKYKMIGLDSMYIKGKEDPETVRKNMPNENFENKANCKILEDVFNMVMYLEDYEKSIKRQKDETMKMIEQDPFAPVNPLQTKSMMNLGQTDKSVDLGKSQMSCFTTYAQRRQQVKSFMCPLGKKCPRVLAGRWPQSEIQSIVPLGASCEFAHTYAELKFEQELKSKKHMLKNYMKTLGNTKDPKEATTKSWNPAGPNFMDCHGCTRCAVCKMRQANLKNIADSKNARQKNQEFLQEIEEQIAKNQKEDSNRDSRDGDDNRDKSHSKKKSGSAMMKFVGNLSKQFQNISKKKELQYKALKKKEKKLKDINVQKKVAEETLNKKIGSLQKATTLYSQERYSEAFKVICRAVEIVKKEMEENEKKEKKEDQEWKDKLGLSADQEITPEIVFQTLNNTIESADQEATAEVLYLYAQKRGIIGKKAPDVNQFLNIQIEEAYLQIEKKLTDKERDINLMKQKIEKLEGEEDGGNQENTKKKDDINHKELCPNLKTMGHCPDFEWEKQQHIWQNKGWGDLQGKTIEKKCKYAHKPLEIYLEKNEQKINNLNRSIKKTQDEIVQSTKPQPYRPPSAQTVILSVDEWQAKERERELGKSAKQQKKQKIDKAHREVIWEKPVEDLIQPVHERPKKPV